MSTQTNPSSTSAGSIHSTVIAVGVDGSTGNRAAVSWAHHEAENLGGRLVLVGASHDYSPPTPRFSIDYAEDFFKDETAKTLERVRQELRASEGEVDVVVGKSGARTVLLQAAKTADILVVGKRGLGAVKRLIVGSNSIAVAGRSPIPVVVVPDAWVAADRSSAPLVAGVEGSPRDEVVLAFAFERAVRFAVPLIVVHAWQPPATYSWSPEEIKEWGDEMKSAVEKTLKPWIERFPDVDVITHVQIANAAMSMLDAAAVAQLVVLGRHTGPSHVGGFHLGSTTRAVLHYSECPVAIIPAQTQHPDFYQDDLES